MIVHPECNLAFFVQELAETVYLELYWADGLGGVGLDILVCRILAVWGPVLQLDLSQKQWHIAKVGFLSRFECTTRNN